MLSVYGRSIFLAAFNRDEKATHLLKGAPVDDVARSPPQSLMALFEHYKYQLEQFQTGDRPLDFDQALTAFATILERPFFRRLWVVQEVAVAASAKYFCGQHEISYKQIFHAVLASRLHVKYGVTASSKGEQNVTQRAFRVLNQIDFFKSRKNRFSEALLYSLIHTFDLSVSNPRDRIFAIRALASIQNEEALQPDYSITLSELWRRATVFILCTGSSWIADSSSKPTISSRSVILAIAGLQCAFQHGRKPSWVPDLANLGLEVGRKFYFYQSSFGRNLAGGKRVFQSLYDASQPSTISFRGVVVDRVNGILEGSRCVPAGYLEEWPPNHEDLRADLRNVLVPWYLRCSRFAVGTMGNVLNKSDIDRILRELLTYSGVLAPQRRRLASRISCLDRYKEHLQDALMQSDQPHDLASTGRMFQHLEMFLLQDHPGYHIDSTWVLALTTRGCLGWVPAHAQLGDRICLLEGAPFPFVLRDRDDGCYTLLGDAYILSIMHGEAWPQNDESVEMIRLK